MKPFGNVPVWSLLISVFLLTGCQRESTAWGEFANEFIEQYFDFRPESAVYAGRHEYDGLMSDLSPEGLDQYISWLKGRRVAAEGFEEASLSEGQRFEQEHLLAEIEGQLFWLEQAGWPSRNPRLL